MEYPSPVGNPAQFKGGAVWNRTLVCVILQLLK